MDSTHHVTALVWYGYRAPPRHQSGAIISQWKEEMVNNTLQADEDNWRDANYGSGSLRDLWNEPNRLRVSYRNNNLPWGIHFAIRGWLRLRLQCVNPVKSGVCVLCGESEASTWDHVLSSCSVSKPCISKYCDNGIVTYDMLRTVSDQKEGGNPILLSSVLVAAISSASLAKSS